MKKTTLIVICIALLSLCSKQVQAEDYLGFKIGKQKYGEVLLDLENTNSQYDDDYGYKGYSDLPMIKIKYYEKFNKFGSLEEGWLSFAPNNKLYKIAVTWNDEGKTFKKIKDALDTKYGLMSKFGEGFKKVYRYNNDQVKIKLVRNTFGFGKDQRTSLIYTYNPLLDEVKAMKRRIEEKIKEKNAEEAASDL